MLHESGALIGAREYARLAACATMLDMIIGSVSGTSNYPDSAIVREAAKLRQAHLSAQNPKLAEAITEAEGKVGE